jgi:hypothetical protein
MVGVEEVAARVVAVLARAEALFAAPGDHGAALAGLRHLGAAADTDLAARSAELSGAAIAAHRDQLDPLGAGLRAVADADAGWARLLGAGDATQAAAGARAAALRATAEEVPARFAASAHLPGAEMAALRVLRSCLAGMQQLIATQSAAAARAAAEVRGLGYAGE